MDFFDYTDALEQQLNRNSPVVTEATPLPTKVSAAISRNTDNMSTLLTYAQQEANNVWKAYEYRRDCMMYIGRFASTDDLGFLPMDKITPRHMRTFRNRLEQTTMSPSTVNRQIAAISGLFRYAMEMDDINDMPAMPKYAREQTERVRVLTSEEQKAAVQHFRDTGDSWMVDIFIVGCLTGMRKGEIVAVGGQGPRAAIIAPDKQSFHPPAGLTKTKKGRKVDLNAQASAALVRLRDCIAKEYTHDIFYNRWWNCKAHLAPHDKTFTFHVPRHTCASNLANAGKNQKLISEILGHSSEKTTAKYVHPHDEAKRDVMSDLSMDI